MKRALLVLAGLAMLMMLSAMTGSAVRSADYLRQISASLAVLASPPHQ